MLLMLGEGGGRKRGVVLWLSSSCRRAGIGVEDRFKEFSLFVLFFFFSVLSSFSESLLFGSLLFGVMFRTCRSDQFVYNCRC